MDAIVYIFALAGVVGVFMSAAMLIGVFVEWLKDKIWDFRRTWQYKHRFNKSPTAKCYCIDCVYYDEHKRYCNQFNDNHAYDAAFCYWAKPDMSKMPNVKEEIND